MRYVEQQTRTGQPGFGLLQLGNVERRDMKTARFQPRTRAREGRRKNYRAAHGQRVRSVRLPRVDVDPFETGEGLRIEPGAIREKRVATYISDGRFQMQALRNGNTDDFISVWREYQRKLPDAFGICAAGEAGKEPPAYPENVAALDLAGQFHAGKLAKCRKGLRNGSGLGPARFRPKGKNDRQFVEDNRRVFHEHRIGKRGLSR